MDFTAALQCPLIGDTLASPTQVSVAEMVVRTVLFLMLLALGGYFFVLFHRRGYFCQRTGAGTRAVANDIRIVSMRPVVARKYLAAVEHLGRRFLLAFTNDGVVKLAEWEMDGKNNGTGSEDAPIR
jgi:hypothetical protein